MPLDIIQTQDITRPDHWLLVEIYKRYRCSEIGIAGASHCLNPSRGRDLQSCLKDEPPYMLPRLGN
jgi:hypothetical protein